MDAYPWVEVVVAAEPLLRRQLKTVVRWKPLHRLFEPPPLPRPHFHCNEKVDSIFIVNESPLPITVGLLIQGLPKAIHRWLTPLRLTALIPYNNNTEDARVYPSH